MALASGSDGTGAPADTDYTSALNRLLALEDISIVAAPGASAFTAPTPASVNQLLIGHAEARRAYRIAVLDTPPSLEPGGVRTLKSLIDSKYAALYYPWIRVANPVAATDPTEPREIRPAAVRLRSAASMRAATSSAACSRRRRTKP